MKYWLSLLMMGAFIPLSVSAANAPSQQKVIREVVVKADVNNVWGLVKNFGALHQWHPMIEGTSLEMRKDDAGVDVQHRLLKLKAGGKILEKLGAVVDEEMKLEYRIVEGDIPVSGYRAIMQVKAGPAAGESTLTWTGRFYNKANDVHAKPGEDNEAAVKVIEAFYDAGLPAFKKNIEK